MSKFKPGLITIMLTAGWLLTGLMAVFWAPTLWLWQLYGLLFFSLLLLELFFILRPPAIHIQRQLNHNLPVNAWSTVTLHIENRHRRRLHCQVFDHHPTHFAMRGLPQRLLLAYRQYAKLSYSIKPTQRGDACFSGIELLYYSRFKLWQRRIFYRQEQHVRVYPNFAEISHYILLASDNHLSQMGVRRRQRRGAGNDFHQLREYRIGDPIKQIDWKATSRYRKLISKEYQDERDQQILFLIDCSRKMRHREHDRVHLDQTLNAMLLLAYVAIRQGDAVGFLSFGGNERWSPPQKGAHTVTQLLNRSYDLQSSTDAADYVSVARKLLPLQRKRALIVMLTNTRNEDHQDLLTAIRLLQRKHLVLLADIREANLNTTLEQTITDIDSALRFHSVYSYLNQRRISHEALTYAGALTLDVTAQQLPVAIVNRYLDIKRGSRL